jgi:excisionase family DNA binding protein
MPAARPRAPTLAMRRPPSAADTGPVAPGGEGRVLTQQEAAKVAGCSKDTIVRARRGGRLPHSRLHDGRWMIPADDLVTAGLASADLVTSAAAGGEDETIEPASLELARAEARVTALEELVARQDDELRFLRQLTTDTLGRRAS